MKKIAGLVCLAVMMFSTSQAHAQQVATIGLGDITYSAKTSIASRPAKAVLTRLNKDIKEALIRTRKFSVLDHAELKTRLGTQGRNLAGYYAKQYSGNAIWQEGLDFILKADVNDFGFLKQNANSDGKTVGVININFELLGVADVTYDFKSAVRGQFSAKVGSGDQQAMMQVLDKAVQEAVDLLVDKIVSSLLPIQIVTIVDQEDQENFGDITLNYGKGFLKVGDTVAIYAPEIREIINELGQPVGSAETTLKVISTSTKFSVARLLEAERVRRGELKPLERGQKGRLLLGRR